MPDVFIFCVENEDCVRIIAVVAMNEGDAYHQVKDEYSTCDVELLESVPIQNLGVMKEIYRFNW